MLPLAFKRHIKQKAQRTSFMESTGLFSWKLPLGCGLFARADHVGLLDWLALQHLVRIDQHRRDEDWARFRKPLANTLTVAHESTAIVGRFACLGIGMARKPRLHVLGALRPHVDGIERRLDPVVVGRLALFAVELLQRIGCLDEVVALLDACATRIHVQRDTGKQVKRLVAQAIVLRDLLAQI